MTLEEVDRCEGYSRYLAYRLFAFQTHMSLRSAHSQPSASCTSHARLDHLNLLKHHSLEVHCVQCFTS